MNMSPIIFFLISFTVSFQGQSAAHPIRGYVESSLEECLDLCQSNSCQNDRNVRQGCNQMFSCAHGCKLRQLGVEKGVCQDLCHRNGQSGCSPNVSGWKFDLCRKCNRGGYSCTKWPQVGECEQGCNFYKGGCDEKDIALTDLASIAVMKSNGWKFDFTDPDAKHNGVGQKCVANGEKAKWFGWSGGNAVGTLSATFTGFGEATVDFGNCWNAGNVKLYLDSTLIETAPVGTKSKIAKVVFTPGSVLKLKDEDGNAVVMLNYVSINCDDWSAGVVLNENGRQVVTNIGSKAFNSYFARCPVVRYTRNGAVYAVYMRTSPVPTSFNAFTLFTDTWASDHNQINKDFKLYNSLEDAKGDEGAWAFCNYDDPDVGFPRDCGKTGFVANKWFSMPGGRFHARGIGSGIGFHIFTGSMCPAPLGSGHLPPGEWDLIFRQVYPGHLFSSGEWQTGDKTQPTFSNLQELEKYRRADGSFHFFLWYPELGEGNEWIQSSNPMTKTGGGVEGYEAVDISFQTQFWGGLENSGVHSLLDGSVNHGHWYYAIGSFHEWGGAIPGPNGPVKKVELYIESTKGSLKLDNEVPYMLVGSTWMPICGHFFWDNNIGADIVCQNLGFQGGVLEKERRPYSEDAYYVGRCDSRSITDLVNGCTKEILAAQYSCKKGRPVSIKVKCKVL